MITTLAGVIEIGLTGGIGSGKSTVADLLVERGAVLIDADRIVRELQAPGGSVFAGMVERWGEAIVSADGSLDRQAVAEIVFNDEDELKALNDLVHPAVGEEMKAQREAVLGTEAIVVLDIPLLVRADGTSDKDRYANLSGIVVVDVDTEIAVERLVEFRGFSEDDAAGSYGQPGQPRGPTYRCRCGDRQLRPPRRPQPPSRRRLGVDAVPAAPGS